MAPSPYKPIRPFFSLHLQSIKTPCLESFAISLASKDFERPRHQDQMETRVLRISLAAVLTAMLWVGASAQSTGCTSALVSLSPCLNYITGNETTPSSSCCSQLATVVQSEPQCLCAVLNGGASSLGITINQTQALALPVACKVQTPQASRCNAIAGPTASPTSPSAPSVPSGGGSKDVPTTGTNFSGGHTVKIPLSITFSLLFAAAYLSTSYNIF